MHTYIHTYIYIYIYILIILWVLVSLTGKISCRYLENKGPSSLRTMIPCSSNQVQTIEFSLESGKIVQVQF